MQINAKYLPIKKIGNANQHQTALSTWLAKNAVSARACEAESKHGSGGEKNAARVPVAAHTQRRVTPGLAYHHPPSVVPQLPPSNHTAPALSRHHHTPVLSRGEEGKKVDRYRRRVLVRGSVPYLPYCPSPFPPSLQVRCSYGHLEGRIARCTPRVRMCMYYICLSACVLCPVRTYIQFNTHSKHVLYLHYQTLVLETLHVPVSKLVPHQPHCQRAIFFSFQPVKTHPEDAMLPGA